MFFKLIPLQEEEIVSFDFFTEQQVAAISQSSFLNVLFDTQSDWAENQTRSFHWHFSKAHLELYRTSLDDIANGRVTPFAESELALFENTYSLLESVRFLTDSGFKQHLIDRIKCTCKEMSEAHLQDAEYPDCFRGAISSMVWTVSQLCKPGAFNDIYTDIFYCVPNLDELTVAPKCLTRLDFSDDSFDLSVPGTEAFIRLCKAYEIPLDDDYRPDCDVVSVLLNKGFIPGYIKLSPLQTIVNFSLWPDELLTLKSLDLCCAQVDSLEEFPNTPALHTLGSAHSQRVQYCHAIARSRPHIITLDVSDPFFYEPTQPSPQVDESLQSLEPLPHILHLILGRSSYQMKSHLLSTFTPNLTCLTIKHGGLVKPFYEQGLSQSLPTQGIEHLQISVQQIHPEAFIDLISSTSQSLKTLTIHAKCGNEQLTQAHLDQLPPFPHLTQVTSQTTPGSTPFITPDQQDWLKTQK